MRIATANRRTSKRWRTADITWPELVDKLRDPLVTGETMREYKAMTKEERDLRKEMAGGFVGGSLIAPQRKTENVEYRSMITLDADNAYPGQWDNVVCLNDFAMACYSTHSSTAEKPRLRFVIPTSRNMTPDEYPAVARQVAAWLGIETMDPTTYEVARLFYFPTVSTDGDWEFHEQAGPLVDVDAVLNTYGYNGAWKDATLWPIAKGESEIRTRAAQKAGDPTEKNGMVGLFCRTYDVYDAINEFLPDVYTPTDKPDRWTYSGGSTSGGAIIYDDGKFLYSNHATDPASGQSCNAFDLIRLHKFGALDDDSPEGTSPTSLPSYSAMCKWAADLPEIKARMVSERQASAEADFSDLLNSVNQTGDDAINAGDDDDDWEARLVLNNKTGECEPSINNALLILLHDPDLKNCFGYDEFAEKPKLLKRPPWSGKTVTTKGRGTLWTDADEAGLRWYMQLRWKFKSENDLRNALELAFQRNRFHPVRDYLMSLQWDGTPRLETVFVRHLGAEDNKFNRTVTRKWFCAAVARVMSPGCKFDSCIILAGPQNLGKSGFADVLSRGWFNDSDIRMDNKDGYGSLHGNWIIELAELASTKRSEVEVVKTFLSKREDTYRPAYARHDVTIPRQCVFFGTTNEQEFLRDRTGNRRFWPISVERKMNRDALEAEVDQIWAEAFEIWRQGTENLYLDSEELEQMLDEVQESRMTQDDVEEEVDAYLDRKLPENWDDLSPETKRDFIQGVLPAQESMVCVKPRDTVSLSEMRFEIYGESSSSKGSFDSTYRRLANIMNNHKKWRKSQKKVRYGNTACFVYYRKGSADDKEAKKQGR